MPGSFDEEQSNSSTSDAVSEETIPKATASEAIASEIVTTFDGNKIVKSKDFTFDPRKEARFQSPTRMPLLLSPFLPLQSPRTKKKTFFSASSSISKGKEKEDFVVYNQHSKPDQIT